MNTVSVSLYAHLKRVLITVLLLLDIQGSSELVFKILNEISSFKTQRNHNRAHLMTCEQDINDENDSFHKYQMVG